MKKLNHLEFAKLAKQAENILDSINAKLDKAQQAHMAVTEKRAA